MKNFEYRHVKGACYRRHSN